MTFILIYKLYNISLYNVHSVHCIVQCTLHCTVYIALYAFTIAYYIFQGFNTIACLTPVLYGGLTGVD